MTEERDKIIKNKLEDILEKPRFEKWFFVGIILVILSGVLMGLRNVTSATEFDLMLLKTSIFVFVSYATLVLGIVIFLTTLVRYIVFQLQRKKSS